MSYHSAYIQEWNKHLVPGKLYQQQVYKNKAEIYMFIGWAKEDSNTAFRLYSMLSEDGESVLFSAITDMKPNMIWKRVF